ncbi:MAG: protein kinase [Rhodothermales bacterium]
MEVSASHKRWRHVQRLFAEVVGLDPERRTARLERVGREDPRLREQLQALLDRHERGEPLTGSPPPSRVGSGGLGSGDSLILGEIVGPYCLLEELGRGAMGIVYRAQDTRLKRPVALKFLSPQLSADKRARARLEREAQAASALDHPNICTVYEIGETDDGRLYLALACYDGETLENRIERGPLAVDDAVRIAVRMARGLAAAHRHGIVHRDVKPSNVLVTEDEEVKILDFGIARVADSDLTGTGDTLGTAAYMSPEHLRGAPEARSDVWALGVVLYEMLTGRRPFRGDYEAALLYAVLHEAPAPLDRDDVPDPLAEIVRRCLEKDPDLRYPSAEEVEVDLERLRLGAPAAHPSRRVSRRTRRLAFGLGGLALLLVLALSPLRTAATAWLGGSGPDVQHLAVLPLMSPAAEASVGEGLTLTLTSLLTQLGSHAERPITVVPASEMREIKTAAEARERFGVGVVVSGDFQREGEQAHLTLNMIDARTLRQLHTERLSESANRLPVLHQRALATLADMLGVPLSEERQSMLTAGGTADSEAYEWYLKGTAALERFDRPENIRTAIQAFLWALEDDSLYALAHAGLGEAYVRKYQSTQDPEVIRLAEQHSRHALRLSNRLAAVRITLGLLYNITGDYSAAVNQFRIGVELEPDDARMYHGLASSYRKLQRTEEAERFYQTAIDLQPSRWQPRNDLGYLYIESGRLEEAIHQFEQVIDLAPDDVRGYEGLATSYLYRGDFENARLWAQRSLDVRPSYRAYARLGDASYYEEDYAMAAQAYERALQHNDSEYTVWGNLGDVYSLMRGHSTEAERAYRHAIETAEEVRRVAPSNPEVLSDLAMYHLEIGENARASSLLDEVNVNVSSDMYLAQRVAVLYERLGRRDQALRWVAEALSRGYPDTELEQEPALRDLITDPRYRAAIRSES